MWRRLNDFGARRPIVFGLLGITPYVIASIYMGWTSDSAAVAGIMFLSTILICIRSRKHSRP